MENRNSFMKRLEDRLSLSHLMEVELAYTISKYAHRHDRRKEKDTSGKQLRYFEHPRRVAIIIIDEFNYFDKETIIAALLHDAVEDTQAVDEMKIRHWFGSNIAKYVSLLTKTQHNKETYYNALSFSPEACLVKFADRIDNLRSLGDNQEFRSKQINETLEKFYPLLETMRYEKPLAEYIRNEFDKICKPQLHLKERLQKLQKEMNEILATLKE